MIKVTPADAAFSKCVKIAVGYRCQRCGVIYGEGHRGLHCSHYIGRGNWSVRFEPANAWAHCYGCHSHIGSRPAEFRDWVIERIGDGRHELLIERSRDTSIGRQARKEQKDIAAHYRRELLVMKGRRDKGEMGEFSFEGYF
jgi:hypothetical protein